MHPPNCPRSCLRQLSRPSLQRKIITFIIGLLVIAINLDGRGGGWQKQHLSPSHVQWKNNNMMLTTVDKEFRSKIERSFQGNQTIFTGAKEWSDHWTYASKTTLHGDGNDHRHDDYVVERSQSQAGGAWQHFNDIKSRYQSVRALPDFYAHGLGWVEDRLGMVFAIIVTGTTATDKNGIDNSSNGTATLEEGMVSIFIVDTIGKMKCGGEAMMASTNFNWTEYQPPLTMWVRANGPEIFAGTALPHQLLPKARSNKQQRHRCTWRYNFKAVPGEYSLHVKLLTFNGFANFDNEKCQKEEVPMDLSKRNEDEIEKMNEVFVNAFALENNFSHHRGVEGFKIYDQFDACCEACARARGCKMWTVPGTTHYEECELYFDNVEDDFDFLDRANGQYLGRERNYSYMSQKLEDFPIIRKRRLGATSTKQQPRGSRRLAIASTELEKAWYVDDDPLSVSGRNRNEPVTYFIGCGWSSLTSFENPCHYPSDDLLFGSGKSIHIMKKGENKPSVRTDEMRQCNLQDELFTVSDGRWVRYPFPDESICPRMRRDDDLPGFSEFMPFFNGSSMPANCWHRDDLTKIGTRCAGKDCASVSQHKWVSSMRESNFFAKWEPYNCIYQDLGDEEIQDCINRKYIVEIETKGLSISAILKTFLNQKLRNLKMSDPAAAGGERVTKSVRLDTLKIPHLLWHHSIEKHQAELDKFANVSDDPNVEHYFVTGFYYSSEREPHVQVDRSLLFSRMEYDTLVPKGYKMINGFDVTAAFTYDTAGQFDGMHILGPPIRSILTKFFHHLCLGDDENKRGDER